MILTVLRRSDRSFPGAAGSLFHATDDGSSGGSSGDASPEGSGLLYPLERPRSGPRTRAAEEVPIPSGETSIGQSYSRPSSAGSAASLNTESLRYRRAIGSKKSSVTAGAGFR